MIRAVKNNYYITKQAKKIPGLIESIAADRAKINSAGKGYFVIFLKDYTEDLACFAYKPNKIKVVNFLFEKFPSLRVTLSEWRKAITSKNKHGESYSYYRMPKSALELVKAAKNDLHEAVALSSKTKKQINPSKTQLVSQ